MIIFSLNTFIKICLLDTGGRISEIQKRLSGTSGYDFYKSFQQSVRVYCEGDEQRVARILAAPTNSVERNHNKAAFESFARRFGKTKSTEAIKQRKVLKFSSAGIAIAVDPVFEVSKADNRQVYSLWPTQKPVLTQKYGAAACHLMRRAYSSGSLANASFYFADIVAGRVYSEKQITNNTNLILMADVTSIGTLVKEL